jgi:hypothetical protein
VGTPPFELGDSHFDESPTEVEDAFALEGGTGLGWAPWRMQFEIRVT